MTRPQELDSPTVPGRTTRPKSALSRDGASSFTHHYRHDTDGPVSPMSQFSFTTAGKPSPVWANRQAASSVQTLLGLDLDVQAPTPTQSVSAEPSPQTRARRRPNLQIKVGPDPDERPPPPPPKSPRHNQPRPPTLAAPESPRDRPRPQRPLLPTKDTARQDQSLLFHSRGPSISAATHATFGAESPVIAQSVKSVQRGSVKPVFIEHSSTRTPPVSAVAALDGTLADSPPALDLRSDFTATRPIRTIVRKPAPSSPVSIDLSKPTFPVPPTPSKISRDDKDSITQALRGASSFPAVKSLPSSGTGPASRGDHPTTVNDSVDTSKPLGARTALESVPIPALSIRKPLTIAADALSTLPSTGPKSPPLTPPRKDDASKNSIPQTAAISGGTAKPVPVRPAGSLALFPRDSLKSIDQQSISSRPSTETLPSTPRSVSKAKVTPHSLDVHELRGVASDMDLRSQRASPPRFPRPTSRSTTPDPDSRGRMSLGFVRQHFRARSPQPPSRPAPAPALESLSARSTFIPIGSRHTSQGQEVPPGSPEETCWPQEPEVSGSRGPLSRQEEDQVRQCDPVRSTVVKQARPPSAESEPRSRSGSTTARPFPPGSFHRARVSDSSLHRLSEKTTTDLVTKIKDLAQQSEALHTRYALLRSDRQKLSTTITSSLKDLQQGPDYSTTLLDQHLSLVTINSSMDICFAKLKALDCRKEEAITSLVAHIEAHHKTDRDSATISHRSLPSVRESVQSIPDIREARLPNAISLRQRTDSLRIEHQPSSHPQQPPSDLRHNQADTATRIEKSSVDTYSGQPDHVGTALDQDSHAAVRNSTIRVKGASAARLLSFIAQHAAQDGSLEQAIAGLDNLELEARPVTDSTRDAGRTRPLMEIDIPTSPFKFLAPFFFEDSSTSSSGRSHSSAGGSSDSTLKQGPNLPASSARNSGSVASSVMGSATDSASSRDEPETPTPSEETSQAASLHNSTKMALPASRFQVVVDDDILDYYS